MASIRKADSVPYRCLSIAGAIILGIMAASYPAAADDTAQPVVPALLSALDKASADIVESYSGPVLRGANKESITEAIYRQARPNVLISNKSLSEKEIDAITRDYIARKYAPALIGNYVSLYQEMVKQNKTFSTCARPELFQAGKNLRASLCVPSDNGDTVAVKYLAEAYGADPKETAVFLFKRGEAGLVLWEIMFHDGGAGSKFYVEGL